MKSRVKFLELCFRIKLKENSRVRWDEGIVYNSTRVSRATAHTLISTTRRGVKFIQSPYEKKYPVIQLFCIKVCT